MINPMFLKVDKGEEKGKPVVVVDSRWHYDPEGQGGGIVEFLCLDESSGKLEVYSSRDVILDIDRHERLSEEMARAQASEILLPRVERVPR